MDPRKLFADERSTGLCVYCGGEPSTRDHIPSKVLLDEPYPADLPVVPACEQCNNSLSPDEQYLACLLEVAIIGTTHPDAVSREKVRRILIEYPALASRLAASRREDEFGNILWEPEVIRIRNVILKLARGHAAYEYSEPQLEEPQYLSFFPLCTMSAQQLQSFENAPIEHLWPEIGSRAFLRKLSVYPTLDSGRRIVQEGRYRYLITHSHGITAKFVLSEYLACVVSW